MRGLFGIFGGNAGAGRYSSALRQYFAALDAAKSGLSRDVAAYITSGEPGSVLSTLSTAGVKSVWQQRQYRYPDKTPARDMMGAEDADDQLVRYGEVMAMLQPIQANGWWGSYGTSVSPDWLRHAISNVSDDHRVTITCSVWRLAGVAEAGGAPPAAVLDILLHPGPGVSYGGRHSLDRFSDSQRWLADNVEVVLAHQATLDAPARAELAHTIGRYKLIEPFLDLLVGYGVSGAKTVRAAAAKALTAAPRDRLGEALAARYREVKPAERVEMVALALSSLGADAAPLLQGWLETETEKRPREVIERALANVSLSDEARPEVGPWERGYVALDGSTVALPPHPPRLEPSAIPREVYDLLRPSIQSYNDRLEEVRRQSRGEQNHWSRHQPAIREADIDTFRVMLERSGAITPTHVGRTGLDVLQWGGDHLKWDRAGMAAFYAHPAVTLRHLVANLRHGAHWQLFNMLGAQYNHVAAQELQRRMKSPEDLLVVADLWVELGGQSPVLEYLGLMWQASIEHLDRNLLWAHVAESFEALDEALGLTPQKRERPLIPANALELLGTLPKVPRHYLLPLMTIATGSNKAQRRNARELLAGSPDIDAAIEGSLGDGRQEVRAGAAEWLAARNAKGAIPGLRKALKKERSEIARAAIITALEKLGEDVSDIFDPAGLLAEAKAGLAKAPAKNLDWFPFDLLPRLAFRDGSPLDPVIVRWWVLLSNKLKQPGGNALLDLWLDRLAPQDAQRLGQFVLRSWIEKDTARASDDEANAFAAEHVDVQLKQNQQWARQYPQHAQYYVTDRDILFARLKREKMGIYLGSAADSKGIMALATHMEGAEAAAAVRAYLKDHGSRVSQAKGLLDMLAANPAPAAIQVVLATANRFKARTVQEHAAALIEGIADRRGWTPEELADRTIPTAGLDENGVAELDCGEDRTWRLALDAADALVILNAEGKPAKALPAPRGEEEKPLIAEAKKFVATARKELKQASAAQTERLYEAMCLERRWASDEWERHLLRHPIVGRILRRIVWIGLDGEGGRLTLFRPTDDGSLTDVEDNGVALDGIAQVQIAHASLVTPAEAEAWRTHLADYEIAPPFAQFDADLPSLTEAMANDTAIDDRKGWMIETFKLRGAAGKAGYVRGPAEDGGWFTTYERRYEAAGLVALIAFSGSPLPEENMAASLQELRFARLRRGSGWHGEGIALKEVPPVLLAESWKDLHRIAAAGTGFDPDWEKKASW